jgi:hypothetical protein
MPFSFFSPSEKVEKDVNASVSQVVHQLIDLLRDGHPEDRVRGCYHALFLISEKYSFPANTPRLGMFKLKGNRKCGRQKRKSAKKIRKKNVLRVQNGGPHKNNMKENTRKILGKSSSPPYV